MLLLLSFVAVIAAFFPFYGKSFLSIETLLHVSHSNLFSIALVIFCCCWWFWALFFAKNKNKTKYGVASYYNASLDCCLPISFCCVFCFSFYIFFANSETIHMQRKRVAKIKNYITHITPKYAYISIKYCQNQFHINLSEMWILAHSHKQMKIYVTTHRRRIHISNGRTTKK